MAMNQSQDKISQAAAATDRIQSLVDEALSTLQQGFDGRIVNGFGVYLDSSSRRNDLKTALDAITAAMEILQKSEWPTDADFRAVDP
jgi:hypothetical protein